MSARTEQLAGKVEASNNALLDTIEKSRPEQWGAGCADGEWTQGFAAYHAATSVGNITGMIQGMASGEAFEPVSFAQIDEMNAAFHAENANRTKDEALAAIRSNAPASVAFVRGLSDAELDRQVALAVGLPPMSVEQVIEMLLVGHSATHRESIEKAR